MPSLELLRADHATALLAFEKANRAYFAKAVPDRGDDYFAHFDRRHAALLAEQADGVCYFHVLVEDGRILGRVNLVDVADGEAELGFRIAQRAAGKGSATTAVREIIKMAADDYDLTRLRAAATVRNAGSRAVLAKTGFVPIGETVLNGEIGTTYVRDLTVQPPTTR